MKLITRNEMMKLYDGTEESAIRVSIEKYERMLLYVKEKGFGMETAADNPYGCGRVEDHLGFDTCALCYRHEIPYESCTKNGRCCLAYKQNNGKIYGCVKGSMWDVIQTAVKKEDEEAFIKGVKVLLDFFKTKLEEIKNRKNGE